MLKKYLTLDKIQIKQEQFSKSPNVNLALTKKVEQIEKILNNLYKDKVNSLISNDMFATLSRNYEQERNNLLQQINIKEKLEPIKYDITYDNSLIKKNINNILKFDNPTFNRSLLLKLIDKIIINDKEIHITYKFAFPEKSGMQKKII